MCETALGAAILIHHSFEGSDKLSYGCLFQGKVSIRAPARGATAGRRLFVADQPVSIRAPARGATYTGARPAQYWRRFNSRSREGSDLAVSAVKALLLGFNSRSREGSDRAQPAGAATGMSFNSRSREGSDVTGMLAVSATCSFNSRSREGSDRAQPAGAATGMSFNSRSREGSDVTGMLAVSATCSFNSRSREGSDAPRRRVPLYRPVSIRAPARGATASLGVSAIILLFQFALPRGERPVHRS